MSVSKGRPAGSWAETPSVAIRGVKALVLTICCAVVIIPFVGVISTSLAPEKQVIDSGGFVLIPDQLTIAAYRAIFAGGVVTRAVGVSVFITVVGTAISLTCTAMLAYALSRPHSFAHKQLLMVVLFALLFTPGIIPSYLVVKDFGLLNSYWSLIVPTAVNAFNVIVLRAFFMNLPQALIDSARIDGASEATILRKVVLPLSKAAMAVVGLFYAVGYWNAFFNALLYINDTSKWPLQLVLQTYVVNNAEIGTGQLAPGTVLPPQQSLQMAILVVAIVPILLVYPFLQRHFAKGVLTGAVKG
jgi:multiple sugar transport system permease protein/putative aldouronate transport system permease protein